MDEQKTKNMLPHGISNISKALRKFPTYMFINSNFLSNTSLWMNKMSNKIKVKLNLSYKIQSSLLEDPVMKHKIPHKHRKILKLPQ